MTKHPGVDVEFVLSALPVLEGAEEVARAGILSALAPANVRLCRAIRNQEEIVDHPRYPLIFDPQTAGGLLATVPAERAEVCVAALRGLGYPAAAIVGSVLTQGTGLGPITMKC